MKQPSTPLVDQVNGLKPVKVGLYSTSANRETLINLCTSEENFLGWYHIPSIFRSHVLDLQLDCRTLSFATGFTPLLLKPLEEIIDIQRAKNKSSEELADIWDDYHLGRGHIGASIKAKLYHLVEHRAADCRYFVLPLWKGRGYTTMFVQVQMPHMLFTGLEDYKARGTQAAPYFTVSCYTEFADSKDLVLIRGNVVLPSKLSDSEAKWLLETAQFFYLNDQRYKLVERFNKETREFEFKDVLKALDMPIM
ncbi:uncharacterized protein [Primulina eburnea]|uniref:uncharacterized protein n=1 Tax=Primulina eburnea TaxID=1245227 RepID=UPI003C6CAF58